MLQLPNNCRASSPAVSPKNWKTTKVISKDWRIYYRFYDPNMGNKMVSVKTMNKYKTLSERKQVTAAILKSIEEDLQNGYNPHLKNFSSAPSVISPYTPFHQALTMAVERLSLEETTRKDIVRVTTNIIQAAHNIYFHLVPIQDVRKSHVKLILEECAKRQERFSDKTFNTYRKYLAVVFNELSDLDAIEMNIIKEIKKKQVVTAPRETLTHEQRIFINDLLQSKYPAFHRFLHIFFHSGARITELLRLQVKDVNLESQRYKTLIIKGKRKREVERTIKNIALPYWISLIQGANENDFVFSRGLVPGPASIQPYQITKRWYRLVKNNEEVRQRFGSIGDVYSLKHSNTSELVEQFGDDAAAQQNGHSTSAMVRSIYDTKRKDRMHEKLKEAKNGFC
jgi:integrase